MCGICGILRSDGTPVTETQVSEMSRSLAHRGPDDEGTYLAGPLGLGHRRLSVIDLANGHQPMPNEDQTVWVVFNGMIYNYKPLAKTLSQLGHRFSTQCDTEVLLHAYEQWGTQMLQRLNGQFAFAIWDGRRLFLARDRLGEKPFYYAITPQGLYFASEIKGLLAHVRAEPAIPPDFFVFENTLTDDTLFKGIKELPPAHYMLVDGPAPAPRRYWSIPNEIDEGLSQRKAVQELRDLVYDAVMIRLQSDVPLGAYLSGGLDSSIIACIGRPTHVFTSYYDVPGKFDERDPAREVARYIKAEQVMVTLQPEAVPPLLEDILYYLDQPISTSSTISSFNLARTAREHCTVVLNGQGADELLGGYGRYVLMHHEAELGQVPFFAQYTPMARRFWNPNVFGDPDLRYLELNARVPPQTSLPADTLRRLFAQHSDVVSQMGHVDAEITLQDLIKMDDRGCAHVGLESRSPFLDHRIAEFAFRLPSRFKIRPGGVTKWILREAAREFVPPEIIQRKDKMGMVSPIGIWLRREHRKWVEGLVANLRGRNLDLPLEPAEDNEYDRRLHAQISLELWFRQFIDGAQSQGAQPRRMAA